MLRPFHLAVIRCVAHELRVSLSDSVMLAHACPFASLKGAGACGTSAAESTMRLAPAAPAPRAQCDNVTGQLMMAGTNLYTKACNRGFE